MKITIKQIATLSGVSKSTVSRYVNGGYVSPEVKLKLSKILMEFKYVGNFHAKNLRQGSSKLIGVLIPRFDSYTAIETLNGINQVLFPHGYQTVVIAKNNVLDNEINYILKLANQGVDAIIISTTYLNAEDLQLLSESPTPILFCGQNYPGIECVYLDEEQIASTLGELYRDKNYNSGLLLTVTPQDSQLGVWRRKALISHTPFHLDVICCDFSIKSAHQQLEEYVAKNGVLPQVVIASTDNLAFGVIQFAQKHNIKIPEELAVVGIGGYSLGQIFQPHLTTVKIDYQQLGRNIAQQTLLKLNPSLIFKPQPVGITLLIGTST